MIRIKKISASETYAIRKTVLRKNIPLPFQFLGDLDEDTFHLGAFKNNELIAVSSFMKMHNANFSGEQYQLRGMATLNQYQGCGAGKLMIEKAFTLLNELKINDLWCNARIAAVNFYAKVGLNTFGDKFEIEFVGEHYLMFKKIVNQ